MRIQLMLVRYRSECVGVGNVSKLSTRTQVYIQYSLCVSCAQLIYSLNKPLHLYLCRFLSCLYDCICICVCICIYSHASLSISAICALLSPLTYVTSSCVSSMALRPHHHPSSLSFPLLLTLTTLNLLLFGQRRTEAGETEPLVFGLFVCFILVFGV